MTDTAPTTPARIEAALRAALPVERIEIEMDQTTDLVMLHDPDHGLEERILREQFDA